MNAPAAPSIGQRYAILIAPSANRVYTGTAIELLRHELQFFADHLLTGSVQDLATTAVGGATYLQFTGIELTDDDRDCLADLSSAYAIFEVRPDPAPRPGSDDDPIVLRPLPLRRLDRFDDDLVSILKYRGKTNELFTKLLINLSAAAAVTATQFRHRRLRVLDPMCGRGTTLNQAALYGWNAYGVDSDKADVDSYATFFQRWLRTKRLKHTATDARLRRDRVTLGRQVTIQFAASKAEFSEGDTQTVEVINTDTLNTAKVYAPNSFDLIVTDAPYGVQHGAERGQSATRTRRPTELLSRAIPSWVRLLRPGGAIGIAWNTHLTTREELSAMLTNAGLQVLSDPALSQFRHRVDQAIDRDLIVAIRS